MSFLLCVEGTKGGEGEEESGVIVLFRISRVSGLLGYIGCWSDCSLRITVT